MLENLETKIQRCQITDSFKFNRKLSQIKKKAGKISPDSLKALEKSIELSISKCDIRASAIPKSINYPEQLPVSGKVSHISELLKQNQVLVVAGDTGSGKTTQLPKMCLEAGYGKRGLIGHTQPRRLAAVSVADRIAEELDVQVGSGVGYQVRFNDKTNPSTFLKLMTDGILLAEIQQDKYLNQYEILIIDEAHERSLNIDFLLGYLKQLLPRRPDLKLIITSATIDLEKFSTHFDKAPVVSVSGRTFPVVTEYKPFNEGTKSSANTDDGFVDNICLEIEGLLHRGAKKAELANDILVFLATEREIRELALALRKRKHKNVEVLPLYSRLRHSEQIKIFQSHVGTRIVLSTNVAETSITVPGIRYVVDTGYARISRYSLQSKVQRLPIEAVSQASANQRQGRCGRVAEGICIRLYSEQDFSSRPEYTDPEILRTNLASVILRMRALNLGEVDKFPYLDAPSSKAINEGYKLLFELNALTPDRMLTEGGKAMSRLPIDPKYARMLVVAKTYGALREVLIIVSALSIQDPREFSVEGRQAALEKFAKFNHDDSDFMSLVNLWDIYETERQELNQNQLRKYCKKNYLSFMRMREWREVHRQLLLACQQMNWRINRNPSDYKSIHLSIIAGSLNQIASKTEGNQYQGNRNRKLKLLSNSVLSSRKVDWIVTGDLLETHQIFTSMAAKIQPQWVEQMAMHLVKREYFSPHWSAKRQQVMAYEKVQLYGITLIEKSLIPFSDIDDVASREIFINEGLIEQKLNTRLTFYKKNVDYLDEIVRQEDKVRRPEIVISESDLGRFFDNVLDPEVDSTRKLEEWVKEDSARNERLCIENSELGKDDKNLDRFADFPDQANINRNSLPIEYVFDPLNKRDGATLTVPVQMIHQLTDAEVDWSVPGIIREKCIALLKGLPKASRKNFIPVSGFVDSAMKDMTSNDGSLLSSLIAHIRKTKNVDLSLADFRNIELQKHLIIKISVVDEEGEEIDFDTDLSSLKERLVNDQGTDQSLGVDPNHEAKSSLHEIEQNNLVDWSFDELPDQVEVGSSLILIRYPALVDKGDEVSIRLFSDPAEAHKESERGLIRLLSLRSVQQKNSIKKSFSRLMNELALPLAGKALGESSDMEFAIYKEAFALESKHPTNRSEFETLLVRGKSRLLPVSEKYCQLIKEIVSRHFALRKKLLELDFKGIDYVHEDIDAQLRRLVPNNLVSSTKFTWLKEIPRYLNAIEIRLEKVPFMGAKDLENTLEIQKALRQLNGLIASKGISEQEQLTELLWMLEELRVSLFAQKLGTKMPVSLKRLEKAIQSIR